MVAQLHTLLFCLWSPSHRDQQRGSGSIHFEFLGQSYWSCLSPLDCYVIHEVYDGDFTPEQFESELEAALEQEYRYIVIEPARLGEETARWISVGNCLHKTALISGALSLLSPVLALPIDPFHLLGLPGGVLSGACAALYAVSWQFDPCCKYQVQRISPQELAWLPLEAIHTSAPVVLVHRDDTPRKRLHNVIALTALVYCVRRLLDLYVDG
nr:PREDICTED: transmembrane protein 11, mitochondrial-like isoform X1 [Latimeria chalumnae]|eukprot:XP_006005143.1 PREDICTED: transmembrane protein 11, mitochondrial-like isoform X1 [Latimeria chalumnae]